MQFHVITNAKHVYLPTYLTYLLIYSLTYLGVRGGEVDEGTALQIGRSGVRFLILSFEFFIHIILLAALWSWGRLNL